ncbi:MAG: tetratricopeptide repeat protein [Nitrospiraceae bacterium]|nr:tetratricopeptide repeat protein [Nitrospiraceae bacterium]
MVSAEQDRLSCARSRAHKAIKLAVVVLLFSSFLIYFLNIDLWDYDFWFHAATGKYIVSHGHPPDKDPFSFTSGLPENKNLLPRWEHFVLGQYVLSQPIFYEVFDRAGPEGMIVLRSLLLVLTLAIAYRRMVRSGASFPISVSFVFLLFVVLSTASGERPVLFSFFFMALLVSLLEDFKDGSGKKILWIVPVMLVWANMHGGFIIGDITLIVYMTGEGIKMLRDRSSFTKKERKIFFIATVASVLASLINPSGWDAFIVSFFPNYKILFENTQEWQSPLYFLVNKIWGYLDYRVYNYVVLLGAFPIIFVARNRKLDLNHVMLLSGMAIMGARSLRLLIFYAIVFTMLMAKEVDIMAQGLIKTRRAHSFLKKWASGIGLVLPALILLLVLGMMKDATFGFGVATRATVPKGAADFIETNRIEGNMLNDCSYGGYLTWRLYPWKQNFIDTRALNIKAMKDYEVIVSATNVEGGGKNHLSSGGLPLWEMLLRHYKVNLVVMAPFDIYGDLFPLTLKLLESDKWAPVYCDRLSLIFVRSAPQNRGLIDKYGLSNDVVYNTMIASASSLAMRYQVNPRYLRSLGEIFYAMNRKEDALKAYQYALKRDSDRKTRERITKIESEIRGGEGI